MQYVLLTRQNDENTIIANKLTCKNIATYHYPLINLEEISFNWQLLKKYTNLIVTSKFAAKIITKNLSHPVMVDVIGFQSASILKNNPYITINNIYYNIIDLKNNLLKLNQIKNYAYVSSNIIKAQLPDFVSRFIIYKTTYTSYLSNDLKEKIKNFEIKSIMIYSENSAKNFIKLCKQENLCNYIKQIIAIALSKQIYERLSKNFSKILYCNKPDHNLMIELLYKIL